MSDPKGQSPPSGKPDDPAARLPTAGEPSKTPASPVPATTPPPADGGAGEASASPVGSDAPADAGRQDPPAGGAAEGGSSGPPAKPKRSLRSLWPTAATLAGIALVLTTLGYFAGLGPLNRLSTTRDLNPPAKVAGLDRITDAQTRERLQLDATRDELSRINDGREAAVEAYGTPERLFMIIALRGKLDVDKEIRESGATGDQVKKVGKSTCSTGVQDIPTSCYRASNSLTVIAQGLTGKVDPNTVASVADEAFAAMK